MRMRVKRTRITTGLVGISAIAAMVAAMAATASAAFAAKDLCLQVKVENSGNYGDENCEDAEVNGEYIKVEGDPTSLPEGELCYKVGEEGTGNHTESDCSDAEALGGEYIEVKGPVWELNGATLTDPISASAAGFVELTDEGVGTAVTCEGALLGEVGPYRDDAITAVEGPNGEISTGATAIECQPVAGLCENEVDVTPVNLPWETELYYGSNGKYRDPRRMYRQLERGSDQRPRRD